MTLSDVERLARRVIVINHGEIVFDDTLHALRRYFGNRKKIRLVTEESLDDLSLPGFSSWSAGRRRTPTSSWISRGWSWIGSLRA